MRLDNKIAKVVLVGLLLLCPAARAATWQLNDQKGWQNISDSPQGRYLLEISAIKQAVESGKKNEALDALVRLKTQFPQFAGNDLDAFIKAEKLFAKNQLSKAAKLYTNFLSEYPDSPFDQAVMERLYSIGAAYLAGQKRVFIKFLKFSAYDEGERILRDLSDRTGDSALAHRSLVTLAESQEDRQLFLEAYQTWAEIADRWPTGETGRESLLRMGQSLHAAYRGPQFDSTVLRGAASYLEDYSKRYPQQAAEMNMEQTLDLIQEQQAYKKYSVGLYYEKTNQPEAAQIYYSDVQEAYPATRGAVLAKKHSDALAAGKSMMEPKTARRKLFDGTTHFLDQWFGMAGLLGLPTGEQSKQE